MSLSKTQIFLFFESGNYDLTQEKDLDAYLKKSSSLEEDWNEATEKKPSELQGADWIKYTLTRRNIYRRQKMNCLRKR